MYNSKNSNTKKCPKCGEVKDATEFHADKSRKDKLKNRCKACCSEQHKTYVQELPDGYMISQMVKEGYPREMITPDLIECKRLILKTNREIKRLSENCK